MNGQVRIVNQNRAIFEALQAQYPDSRIAQSSLRCEKTLGAVGSVSFDVGVGINSPNVNEIRLAQKDKFCVIQWGLYTYKIASGANISSATLQSYPNNLLYTGTGEAAAIQSIYNGFLAVSVENVKYIQNYPTLNFLRTGMAQKSVLTAASGAGSAYVANQWDSMLWGKAPVDPTFTIIGEGKNDIILYLPDAVDKSGTSSTNYVSLWMDGFLIQA